ncbi:hypothetical protein [Paenibacillus larvae]|uniref:Uncharacterized protein n=2 Tax=Paenibacillus larvae TaxID=1464 RepID=V9WBI0_9BACL|nr:hypothetical protein [Paenibacillus larvae]AHD06472.1 hypothetical protein ERIC2_c26850 [Paenibacillus larvae subsp. larvae DSM 25430]AVG13020.1 hypothetical protein ERICII_02666 [Paenibacillus larvae subsp. larvae DSM 25430]MDR5596738.1 hypothetical protein [Paenibacillus larvae]
MSNVVFSASGKFIGNVAQGLADRDDDSVLILAPFAGEASTYAPSKKGKYKGYYRLELNVLIPDGNVKLAGGRIICGRRSRNETG